MSSEWMAVADESTDEAEHARAEASGRQRRRDMKVLGPTATKSGKIRTAKRQRVSQACDQCRVKKDRCDGDQPCCSTCLALSRQCRYAPTLKKRGLPTGYVRIIESLWGSTFENITGSEDMVFALLREKEGRPSVFAPEGENPNLLLEVWRNSAVAREIERRLFGSGATDEGGCGSVKNDGLEGGLTVVHNEPAPRSLPIEWKTYMHNRKEVNVTVNQPVDETENAEGPRTDIYTVPGPNQTVGNGHPHSAEAITTSSQDPTVSTTGQKEHRPCLLRQISTPFPGMLSLVLPTNWWRLLDIYFAYTQCWLPMMEKHDVLRLAYSYSEDPIELHGQMRGSGKHAALWAMLAYASHQDEQTSPTQQSVETSGHANFSSAQLSSIARQLIPTEGSTYELGHIQALLLLGLIQVGTASWTAAWLLVGHAVRIAIDMGLSDPSFDLLQRQGMDESLERRRHTYLACFVMDTLVSARLGRTPYLRSSKISNAGLPNEDGLEEWHPWIECLDFASRPLDARITRRMPCHALSTFNQLLKVIGILNDFLQHDPSDKVSEERYRNCSSCLQEWYVNLPRHCVFQDSASCASLSMYITPQLLNLQLTYATTNTIIQSKHAGVEYSNLNTPTDRGHGPVEGELTILGLLQRFSDAIGLRAANPMFELFALLASRQVGVFLNGNVDELSSVRARMDKTLSDMALVWPGVKKIQEAFATRSLAPEDTGGLQGDWMVYTTSRDAEGARQPLSPVLSSCKGVDSLKQAGVAPPVPHPAVLKDQEMETSIELERYNLSQQADTIYSLQGVEQPRPTLFPDPSEFLVPHSVADEANWSNSAMSGSALANYSSAERIAGSTDVDALFDELASLDGSER